ncbi:MAG: hypothetical protein ACRDPW_03830, partial [Mycobacteriales bacterium]
LRYRGEVVLNSDYGAPERNLRAVVAFADEPQLDRLRQQLWQASGATVPPRVFYARRPGSPRQLMLLLTDDHGWLGNVRDDSARDNSGPAGYRGSGEPSARAILGLPISVSVEPVTFTLSGDPGCAVALLGEGRDDALGVLGSAALSLSVSRRHSNPELPPARYVLLDGIGGARHSAELTTLAQTLRSRGHEVELVPVAGIGERLIALEQELQTRLGGTEQELQTRLGGSDFGGSETPARSADGNGETYIIGAGLHRASRLAAPTMAGAVPAQTLAQLVREGPLVGMHLLAWWNSARIFTEQLGYEAAPLVAGVVFLRAPEADVQALCGPYLRFNPQLHRALFVDRGSGGAPVELVPFGSLQPDQAEVVAAGGSR